MQRLSLSPLFLHSLSLTLRPRTFPPTRARALPHAVVARGGTREREILRQYNPTRFSPRARVRRGVRVYANVEWVA